MKTKIKKEMNYLYSVDRQKTAQHPTTLLRTKLITKQTKNK